MPLHFIINQYWWARNKKGEGNDYSEKKPEETTLPSAPQGTIPALHPKGY